MNNFSIDKKDLEQLEAILRNNTNIERLYQKLYNLEIKDKKNTEEYTKLLDYLSIVIDVEEKLYKEANLTVEKTLSWLKFLRQTKDIDNRILIRINTTLFDNLVKQYDKLINLPDKEIPNILTMSGMKLKDEKANKEDICKSIIIKETIQKDIFYIFISFLQKVIDNTKNQIVKEKLLQTKYEAIFLNKDIESYAIKNNLNLPETPYSISKLIQEILKIDQQLYKEIKDLLCSKIVLNEIYELLEIDDFEYNDIYISSNVIKRECMMKASLIFMSEEKINDINYTFHEYIEDKEYSDIHPYSNVSENIIINCFKNINKDKKKIKSLSL